MCVFSALMVRRRWTICWFIASYLGELVPGFSKKLPSPGWPHTSALIFIQQWLLVLTKGKERKVMWSLWLDRNWRVFIDIFRDVGTISVFILGFLGAAKGFYLFRFYFYCFPWDPFSCLMIMAIDVSFPLSR